ncbi:exosortase F system-associated protein [Kaistella flava (ex Peng et al. 2021)]|uniref:Exosortase F system-associated protein n=1 Tax=Kaistella flava (ex Peng et al. 2021) TaxID=2038776 RepID=A0A7M2YBV4_9FLAO|nr:exosortase F system-associated protein [Kaistella flava (ex Peng et al. 2021)]QOW10922.1 exosortase F system-associated protein [Kaistella flava (ex Peng et al. 2021)]
MKVLKWLLVAVAVFGLIAVRVVESEIFYDPFQEFFHLANKHASFPDFNWLPLILNYLFRFGLNLLLSAAVVSLIFKNKQWTLQAIILILIVFVITFPIYLYCIHTKFEIGYLFSFYMRRFVIQPLILLLIIPLFYYRQHIQKV